MPKRFRDFVGVSVNEDEAVGDPASGVELLGMSCAADSNYSINIKLSFRASSGLRFSEFSQNF